VFVEPQSRAELQLRVECLEKELALVREQLVKHFGPLA
jgi:hypothetical protein